MNMLRILLKLFILLVLPSILFCEIKNISILPDGWANKNYITVTIESDENIVDWEYLFDNILNEQIDSENWISANTSSQTFLLENIPTGVWEVWIRGKLKDETFTEGKMVKCYIDISPPQKVESIHLKEINKRLFVFWDDAKDEGSGIKKYVGRVDDKVQDDIKSGMWEIKSKKDEFEIIIWAEDMAGNEGEKTIFKKTKTTKIEKITKASPPQKKKQATTSFGNIDITGYRTYTTRYSKGLPGATGFSTPEHAMNLSISGDVGRNLRATGTIEDMPYQDRRIVIDLKSPQAYIRFGDFNASLPFGDFASLPGKTITGVEAGYQVKNINLKFLTSQARSVPTTSSIYGSGIKGPYQFSAWIVEGSETIRVDDKDRNWYDKQLARDVDYEINYITGEIWFKEVMWSTTKITMTYEFGLPFISRQGDILAFQADLPPIKKQKMKFIYLRETAPASGGIDRFYVREERHQVKAEEGNIEERQKEYPLDNWPISEKTETVYINTTTNFPKTNYEFEPIPEGGTKKGDYWIDYDRGTIAFRKDSTVSPEIIPPTKGDIIILSYNSLLTSPQQKEFTHPKDYDVNSFNTGTSPINLNITSLDITNKKRVRVWWNKINGEKLLLTPKFSEDVVNKKGITERKWECYDIVEEGKTMKIVLDPNSYLKGSIQSGDKLIVEYRKDILPEGKDEVKKEVIGLQGDFKVGKIGIQSEIAISQGDKIEMGTPIPNTITIKSIDLSTNVVTYELIDESKTPPEKISKTTSNIQGPYELSHKPIFQSPYAPIKVLRDDYLDIGSSFYNVMYNDGKITFSGEIKDIVEGTEFRIEYRYLDPKAIAGGVEKTRGTAFKSSITSSFGKLTTGTTLRFVENDFDPIGIGRIQAEKYNIISNLSYKFSKNINFSSNFSQSLRPEYIKDKKISETKLAGAGGTLSLSYPKYPTLSMTYNQNTTEKDKTKQTKSNSYNINSSYSLKQWTFSTTATQTSTNNIPGQTKTKTPNYTFRVGYKPLRNLDINASFNTAKNISEDLKGKKFTTSKTNTTDFSVAWLFKERYRITSKYNLQKVTSPTTSTSVVTLDTGFNVSPNTLKIKNFPTRKEPVPITNLSGNYTIRKDLISAGGTDNRNYNISLGMEPHKIVSISTNYNNSKTKGRNVDSVYDNFTIRSQINPRTKNKLQFLLSYSTNTSTSARSKTRGENYSISSSITPLPKLSLTGDSSVENRKESKSTTFTLRANYPVSPKLSSNFTYLIRNTSPKVSATDKTSQDELNMGLNYKMGKMVTGSFDFKYIDYEAKRSKPYSGYTYTARIETRF